MLAAEVAVTFTTINTYITPCSQLYELPHCQSCLHMSRYMSRDRHCSLGHSVGKNISMYICNKLHKPVLQSHRHMHTTSFYNASTLHLHGYESTHPLALYPFAQNVQHLLAHRHCFPKLMLHSIGLACTVNYWPYIRG